MIEFNSCKKIINRMLIAYDAKTLKSLSELLNTTVSVMGNRVARNSIPYDLIVKCAIDTKFDLEWLLNGVGEPKTDKIKDDKKLSTLTDETLEKLERLNTLKEKGAITTEEFNILKANLIN